MATTYDSAIRKVHASAQRLRILPAAQADKATLVRVYRLKLHTEASEGFRSQHAKD